MKPSITTASKRDKKSLMRFYKQQFYSAGLLGLDSVYIIKDEQEIIGAVIISAIEKSNNQLFLHALVIKQEFRHKKLATRLIQHVRLHHEKQQLFCFAQEHLAHFYQQNGFSQVSEHLLLQPLLRRYSRYKKTNNMLLVFKCDV